MRWSVLILVLSSTACGAAVNAQSAGNLIKDLLLDNIGTTNSQKPRASNKARVVPPQSRYSAEVARIQTLLNRAGYSAGPVDGIAGRGTTNAIILFQRSLGHVGTGQLTPEEHGALESAGKNGPQQSGFVASVEIREVQKRLTDLGYDVGTIDGQWGSRSQAGLDTFRAENGVSRNGRPTTEDVALLTKKKTTVDLVPSTASVSPKLPAGLKTVGRENHALVALPIVDRGSSFRISWEAPRTMFFGFAILDRDENTDLRSADWEFVNQSPARMVAPQSPGQYDIVWLDPTSGDVLVRRPLEVR